MSADVGLVIADAVTSAKDFVCVWGYTLLKELRGSWRNEEVTVKLWLKKT